MKNYHLQDLDFFFWSSSEPVSGVVKHLKLPLEETRGFIIGSALKHFVSDEV